MAVYERHRFEGVTVELDGHVFEGNTFVRCTIVYRGGIPPILRNNRFEHCVFALDGAAANTVTFLRDLLKEKSLRSIAMAWLGLEDRQYELSLEDQHAGRSSQEKADA
jgi:hypothetical protein